MIIKKTFFFLVVFLVTVPTAMCQQVGQPNPAGDYIKQGNACYDNKEYSKSISLYTEVIKANPKSIEAALAHYKCAKAFEVMGKYNKAISECSKSIAIDPLMNKAIAYLLRGFLYEKIGKYMEAFSDYSKALIINPNNKAADLCRKKILVKAYVEFTNKGLVAFDRGINAYKSRNNLSAKKNLDEALSFFAYARRFDTEDQTALGMTNFTKGLLHEIIAREILDAMKPANSGYQAMVQLRKAYYLLAVTNTYYNKALLYLKYERLINSVKERKGVNDQDIAMVKNKLPKVDYDSANYMKSIELEAECVVNFDTASELLGTGDHEGVKRLLNENDELAAGLKRLKDANAEGISYLSSACARLNTMLSYPLEDTAWMEANKASLKKEINAYIDDLNRAKPGLVNTSLLNTCLGLLQNISGLRKATEEVGSVP